MSTKEKVREKVVVKESVSFDNEIVMYNDDVNTFDHVIDTLIRVCNHTAEQAEQCSLIVHYKGKCTVKTGSIKELTPQCFRCTRADWAGRIGPRSRKRGPRTRPPGRRSAHASHPMRIPESPR